MRKTILTMFVLFLLMLGVSSAADLQFMDKTVTPSLPTKAIVGSNVQYTYSVKNAGTQDLSSVIINWSNMIKQDEPAVVMGGFSAGSSAMFALNAGASTPLNSGTFTVPTTQKAGTYKSSFFVRNGTATQDTFDLLVGVENNPSVSVSSASTTLVQGRTGQLTITVQNTGNMDLTLNYVISAFSSGANMVTFNEA